MTHRIHLGLTITFEKLVALIKLRQRCLVFAVKPITTGEGGAICTDDPELDKSFKLISSHYITREGQKDPWMYDQIRLGYNFGMTDSGSRNSTN